MPVIKKEQITAGDLAGNSARVFANKDLGSASLTVTEITVEPGGEIRLHTHPGHEECMVILSGDLQATMGDVVEAVSAGACGFRCAGSSWRGGLSCPPLLGPGSRRLFFGPPPLFKELQNQVMQNHV